MKWVLTPDEFTHVWENETGLDRRPYPISMAQAATARTETEYAALRLPQRFAKQADPELAAALTLCARTDATTITVSGERTVSSGPKSSRPSRPSAAKEPKHILAFAAVVANHGAILVAAPDQVTVQLCSARNVGKRLVKAIGSTRPGRLATMRESQDAVLDLDDTAPRFLNGESSLPGPARFRQQLRKPVDGRGFITVTVEPDNPMSPPTRHRTWLDFTGDGRYLLTTATDLVLAPAADTDFATKLLQLAHIR